MSNQKQQKNLIALKKILEFGKSKFINIPIDKEIKELRKYTILNFIYPVHDLCETSILLLEKKHPTALAIITRSLLEAHIKANFIISDKSNYRARLFYIQDDLDRRKTINLLVELINKDPTLEKLFKSKRDLELKKEELDKSLAEFEQQYGKIDSSQLTLFGMAKEIDRKNNSVKTEHLYRTLYWLFSSSSHFTARGVDKYLNESLSDSLNLSLQNTNYDDWKECNLIYRIYLDFLYLLSRRFKIPKLRELKEFDELLKEIS